MSTQKGGVSQHRNECFSTYLSIGSCATSLPARRSLKRRQIMFVFAQPSYNQVFIGQASMSNVFLSLPFYCGLLLKFLCALICEGPLLWTVHPGLKPTRFKTNVVLFPVSYDSHSKHVSLALCNQGSRGSAAIKCPAG